MAGRPKRKLDYAGWSVDIFDNDTKIDKLLDAQGWIGFSVYFYLCLRAFGSDGYFYKWSYDDCASTARKMGSGISSGTIYEVVGYCLQIGLFDRRLFDEWGVLTSKGIQRSFWTVAKSRRDKTVFRELWLLKESECEGIIFVPFFDDMSVTNDHLQTTNDDMLVTNDTVVKESKVNHINDDGGVNIYSRAREEAEKLIVKYWGRPPTNADVEHIRGLIIVFDNGTVNLSDDRMELLEYAFECSVSANVMNWNYIHGVIERLKARNITTLDEAYNFDIKREYGGNGYV